MENNNLSNNKSISIGRLIITLFVLIVVITGGTFAWLTYSSKQSALVLTIGNINNTQIKLSPYELTGTMTPSTTYSGGVYSDVEVTKGDNNATSFALFYKINQLDPVLIEKGLSYTIINTQTGQEVKSGYFSDLPALEDTSKPLPEEVIILNTDTETSLSENTSVNYRVYLWVNSEKGNQNDIQGTTLDVELNASIGSVTITGNNTYGETLTSTINDAVIDNTTTYSYQWYMNTSASTTGGTAISGATSSSYTIGNGLVGKYIYLVVTTSKDKTLSNVISDKVAARAVTISTGSSEKVYDGSALTNSSCNNTTLLSGHTITCVTGGTITNAGSLTNNVSSVVIKDSSGTDVTDNYGIIKNEGTLTVSKKTLSLGTYSATYNGTKSYTRTFNTGIGDETLTLTYAPYEKTVGNYSYVTSAGTGKYTVTMSDGTGIASNYIIDTGSTFTINKAALTISAYSTDWVSSAVTYTRSNYSTGVNNETITLTYTPYSNTAGTYTYATSAGSGKFTLSLSDSTNYSIDSVGDLVLNKVNATCPAVTGYSGTYDANSHTVTVSGGSGGTIQYRTSSTGTWTTTKPTRTDAGTTTVYVQVAGDTNHNTVDCGSKSITINKVNCSCSISSYPTGLDYPKDVSGAINYSCSGDGEIYVNSGTTSVITTGTVGTTSATLTAVDVGSSTITVGRNAGTNYNACSVTQSVSVTGSPYTITGYSLGSTIPSTTGWTVASGSKSATKTVSYASTYGTLPSLTRTGYTFGGWYSNIIKAVTFTQNSGVSGSNNGVFLPDYSGYAATPELIPIVGGITLYSNMSICGIYSYDSSGNLIKRESNYASVHPISSNASYIRIELNTSSTTYSTYMSDLVITTNEDAFSLNSQITASSTNQTTSDHALFAKWIDAASPSLSLTKTGTVEGFRGWSLSDGATIDTSTQILTLNTGYAYSPYIPVGSAYYGWSFDLYPGNASTYATPNGSMFYSNLYFDSNFAAKVGDNGYSANGVAPTGPVSTWTTRTQSNYNYGSGIEYYRMVPQYSSTYSSTSVKMRNMKIYGDKVWAKNYTINVTASDNVGITTRKYASGSRAASYFASSGTAFTGNSITVTANGTYTVYVADAAGNSAVSTITIDRIDNTAPTITSYAGKMLYEDLEFSSGTNGAYVYNNSGGGTVTVARAAEDGYNVLKIQTTGTASPGHGGFTWGTPSAANKEFIVFLNAKIPVGYQINFASNATGNSPTRQWLTSQAGTGRWQTYVFRQKCGSSGTFSSTNYFYLTGGSTATSSSPVTWYVDVGTVFDTTLQQPPYKSVVVASDTQSGVVGYMDSTSNSQPSSWTQIYTYQDWSTWWSLSANQTRYIWYADAAGNVNSTAVSAGNLCSPTASASASNKTYTGASQTGATGSNVTWTGTRSATNAGSYTAYATPSSGYCWSDGTTGQKTVSWTMSKKSVAVSWGSTTSFTYSGSAQAPTASASSGVSGETINVTRTTGTNAGSYTSTASCSSVSGGQATCNNYTLTGTTKAFTIGKATPTLTQSATSGSILVGSSATYTIKSSVAGKFTVASNATGKATTSIDSAAATAAGTNRTVTVNGISGGSATITVTFTPTDTTNYKSVTKTYAATVSAGTRYKCEGTRRLAVYYVTSCSGGTCTWSKKNGLTSSYSFSLDTTIAASSPSSYSVSSTLVPLSSVSGSSCYAETWYVRSSGSINCRNGASTSNTTILTTKAACAALTVWRTTMKVDSTDNWWYHPGSECFIHGSNIYSTKSGAGCSSSGGGGGSTCYGGSCVCYVTAALTSTTSVGCNSSRYNSSTCSSYCNSNYAGGVATASCYSYSC